MFAIYVVFAMVWAVLVAAAKPPLIFGALLVAAPVIAVGHLLRNSSKAPGAP